MGRYVGSVLFLAAVAGLTTACGSSGPASYLYTDSSSVVFIQWQPDASGSGIQGTLTEDAIGGTAPSETVAVTNVPITGAINGSSVTLHSEDLLSSLFGISTLNGTLNGNTLTFNVVTSGGSIQQGTLTQADTSAYNAAVAALHKRVQHINLAAAQAQAAQARQQQDDQAIQTAQNDLSTVQNISFGGDLRALASDVRQTNSDLAGERKDAAAGPNADGGNCYNLQQNVEYDAQQNVDYDLQQNVGYDLQQNLLPDIQTARQDIAALQSDLQTLSSAGLAAPQGAAAAISAVQAEIRQAKATANADIDQANADDVQAYAIANSMATGNCAGDGLGKPTALLAHI